MSLDGFSMRPLVRELNRTLAGGRIDKITQPNKQSIVLSIRQPGQNQQLHICINSQNPAAHLMTKNLENPPEPPVTARFRPHSVDGRGFHCCGRQNRNQNPDYGADGQIQQYDSRTGWRNH